jgi:hypothetical protein
MLATYFHQRDRAAALPRLLSGHDLIATFHLKPGERVGELLADLREAQVLGQVATRDEALAWVTGQLREGQA